ncbi:phage antirepressor KilAC domain-containing protein [Agathobaculum sp. TL06]|jgi:prophage antirepressor-like protein|uniref:BRO family protein n=1 Tax=Eubacteriales TaxID=186802 RepID=UPI0025BE6102|nr:phage antirepressor KilAC domain-containing protein [Fournierella sp.]
MNQMEIFKNPEFGSVRVIEENGKYLFCGVDVAKALGYTKPQNAIDRHCPHALKRGIGVQTGKKADGTPAVQMVEMLFIPEGDVYRLIVHSKLPSAERFERWVFDEVLPSIRKHGAYMTKEKLWEVATSPEALMKLCSDLLAEREKNAALRADNARLKGKAAYYDLFIDLHHSTNLRTTAKELVVPERQFVRFLLEQRFVYRTPSGCVLPYAKSSNEGLFCVKDYYRNGHSGSYTLVTPKGKLYFADLRDLILVTV